MTKLDGDSVIGNQALDYLNHYYYIDFLMNAHVFICLHNTANMSSNSRICNGQIQSKKG